MLFHDLIEEIGDQVVTCNNVKIPGRNNTVLLFDGLQIANARLNNNYESRKNSLDSSPLIKGDLCKN